MKAQLSSMLKNGLLQVKSSAYTKSKVNSLVTVKLFKPH